MERPPALAPGDRVRVVAPSSPFDATLVWRGLGWLSKRYRVEFDRGMFAQHGFLAGSDARRLAELQAALAEPGIKAVVAARGGYGLARILPDLDVSPLGQAPRWVVGFSDVTALHAELWRVGICSLHAHNAAGLGRGSDRERHAWLDALEKPEALAGLSGLASWRGGVARGPLVGGNLTVLFSSAAAGRLELPDGSVLAIEDVTETSYRVDRMLVALRQRGTFARLSGVLVGEFCDCSSGKYGVPIDAVLREHLLPLGLPVLAGAPFGHGRRNAPLLLGRQVKLDANQGTLTYVD